MVEVHGQQLLNIDTCEETPVYAAPDKDSGAVSTLPAGDVDWDKYEILPDGNWYSFVKNGQRYYISYSDVGTLINDLKSKHDNSYKVIMFFMFPSTFPNKITNK